MVGTIDMAMRRTDRTAIEDAQAALQPFYTPEDDGYPIRLALNALAGVLGSKAGIDVEAENGLSALLDKLNAPGKLKAGIDELYKNAAGGEYGAGLSKRQADAINDLVQTVVDPLVEYITTYRRLGHTRPSTRSKSITRRSKR